MFQRLWAAAAVLTVIAAPVAKSDSHCSTAATCATSAPPRFPNVPLPAMSPCPRAYRAVAGITLDSTLLAGFRWRNIGPANMMGRVSAVAGIPSPSRTFFIAAAAGGIWKTTNAGTTFPGPCSTTRMRVDG